MYKPGDEHCKALKRANYQRHKEWYHEYYRKRAAITPKAPPRAPKPIRPFDLAAQKFARDRSGRDKKAWLQEYKSSRPCTDCGVKYPAIVMDFDHIGPKSGNIATMVSRNYNRERIEHEISKCELVCSNCHRLRTLARRTASASPTH